MPTKKLIEFLDSNKVKYLVISHSPAYTAQEIAGAVHMPGKELAKTVMIKVDGEMAMAVLPADDKVDFDLLKEALKAGEVTLAGEEEFMDRFPDCEIGAMPPFGNLYGMEVYVTNTLTEDEEIGFNAGSHEEIVKLTYKDFEKVLKPKVLKFAA